jgi:hypothetical protein
MQEAHLEESRVWELIRSGQNFSPEESKHLGHCAECSEVVSDIRDLARRSGFKITFQIPIQEKKKRDGV